MTLPDFLTGHRIGLYTVVRRYREGYPAEKIAEEFPSLPLDLVRKVIAFYQTNQVEVDIYVEEYWNGKRRRRQGLAFSRSGS